MHENYNWPVRITASAPTRIDLAGGTIDIWPVYLFHPGAQTLNIAISLRAHARVEARADEQVALVSEDTNREVVLPPARRSATIERCRSSAGWPTISASGA